MIDSQEAMLGVIVRAFTDMENSLRDIGACIDELVVTEDDHEFREIVSSMYFKLSSMSSVSIESLKDKITSYITSKKEKNDDDIREGSAEASS